MIFNLFTTRRRIKDYRGLSPLKKAFFYALIFGATSLAFYYNFNHRLDKIRAKYSFYDENKIATSNENDAIINLIQVIRKNFSTETIVHLVADDIYIPDLSAKNLFMALSVNKEQSLVIYPNLINKALTKEQKRELESNLLLCKQDAPPASCLAKSLEQIINILNS